MELKKNLTVKDIEEIFGQRKPGAEAGFRFFSVLVPVVRKEDKLMLLYEVRAKHMERQPGEVCFPGGELEADESTEECALRETWEEVGISADKIRIINQLDTIYTYSNFAMYCYLGIIDYDVLDNVKLNPDEVDEIFTVDIDKMLETEAEVYKVETVPKVPEDFPYEKVTGGKSYRWRGGWANVPVYDIDGRIIWGLTARITKGFLDTVKERIEYDV